jgi:hypothetical protein
MKKSTENLAVIFRYVVEKKSGIGYSLNYGKICGKNRKILPPEAAPIGPEPNTCSRPIFSPFPPERVYAEVQGQEIERFHRHSGRKSVTKHKNGMKLW